jgi:outer membrane protein with beta-barrel domain
MLRRALLVTPFLLLLGCASPSTSPVIVGEAASVSGTEAPLVEGPAAPDAATGAFTDFAPQSQVPPMAPPPRPRQRFTLKGGYYGSSEDGLDDGYIIIGSFMRPTSGVFATEYEIGYLDASGSDKGVDRDVWSIPLLVNGRFNVPVGQRIELYGGLGLGSFYYEADAKTAGVKVSADGFLFGGDAFFGGDIHLGQSLSLGLEGKYYLTDNASDLDGSLDAYVVMLTLGFDR